MAAERRDMTVKPLGRVRYNRLGTCGVMGIRRPMSRSAQQKGNSDVISTHAPASAFGHRAHLCRGARHRVQRGIGLLLRWHRCGRDSWPVGHDGTGCDRTGGDNVGCVQDGSGRQEG